MSLVDPSRLWLHSLHLTLTACKTSPDFPLAIGPVINMDKVNAIMADMDATVPDRAKGLMSAMTAVQKVTLNPGYLVYSHYDTYSIKLKRTNIIFQHFQVHILCNIFHEVPA